MEYEIEDEDVLFDDSTNPSLKQDKDSPRTGGTDSPQREPVDKRKLQRAELIPEEEHQLS